MDESNLQDQSKILPQTFKVNAGNQLNSELTKFDVVISGAHKFSSEKTSTDSEAEDVKVHLTMNYQFQLYPEN
jgi:hypothetical protein